MKLTKVLMASFALLIFGALTSVKTQTGNHFAKDGLSFDYAPGWQVADQSTGEMQYLILGREGYAQIMVRSPRGTVDTPEKEAAAKRLIQDGYIDAWAKNFADQKAAVERSTFTTEILGAPGECTRLKAALDDGAGHVDLCWRFIEKRMVQLVIVGPDADISRTTTAWDTVRKSIKIDPPPAAPAATPKPKSE